MRKLKSLFLILLCCSLTACAREELHGVFSNQAGGFETVTFMVNEDGYAYFHASVVGFIGKWTYNNWSSVLTFEYFDPGTNRDGSLRFVFDSKSRSYTLVYDGASGRTDSSEPLHFITNTIPEKLIQAFRKYPVELEKRRRVIQGRVASKRRWEEKLAREKPEYERIRRSIVENSNIVVSEEFYVQEDTPATRALKSTLDDHDVEYPEDVLMALLEELPPDNHHIRELIFTRPELSSVTIENFYLRALDWGARLNYMILANIATHPNTPRQLIEEIAINRDLPSGATQPAQKQMVKYARKITTGQADNSQETFRHLYDFALQMLEVGSADGGKAIILVLAKSATTPRNILLEIADTDDQTIQRAVVSNTNTPMAALKRLSSSRFPRVRADVICNPDIPVEILLSLSDDTEGRVRAAIAAHPATPPTKLVEMQSDEFFDVRQNLIRNPNTPDSVLKKLANDHYTIIKSEAQMALRTRHMQKNAIDRNN